MKTALRSTLKAALAALVLLPLAPSQAQAIPAFARKYKLTCALCHAPIPRLTAFGETFAGNGFQMARGETPVDTLTTGDPMLRLQRDIPLAIRVDAYMSGLSGNDDVVSTDLKIPWGIKVLSGGQITNDISYYMYFFLSERGEVAGLEDAYLQFNDVLGSGWDLLAGQFQISDPLYKRELRLEYEDYMPYRVRVGDVRADLTYERGLMAVASPWKDADLFVQVVNGKGLSPASEAKNFDTDNGKHLGLRLSQDLGFARVGGFFYTGAEQADPLSSSLQVFGPDATIPLGEKVEFNLQYLYRKDSNPFFLETCARTDTRCSFGADDPFETEVDSYMGEMLFFPKGAGANVHFTALYNRIEANSPIFTVRAGEEGYLEKYESVGFTANYLYARNVRLVAEVSRNLELKRTRFIAGVTAAF
ncbi:MAG TPA: hypothetical protein VLH75_07985 [Longimicrobiales bacterium]|nr:hypothetical protein [Longimicrobiales bacterium]